ncbi:MmgE/PrpD family protein [Mesorhizobium yinganensis]|uniref:MmgE/PrpD family protein n=1 Tax=Mesorhizobium yinganensis TaxID=3157707 RepID=UPI0032B7819E
MNVPAPSITESLVELLSRPRSDADRACAALHLVDWLGCAAIGHVSTVGGLLSPGNADGAALPLAVSSDDPAATAFALGGLGSVLEMDDIHRTAILHPGPVVMPAALAFARDIQTATLLDAIVAGYEAMVRIAGAVGAAHYAVFHNTATCGGFGAAAAAAHALGLDKAATVSALGNAGTVASGLWQCRNEPVMTKTFHVAEAARRGVAAAVLAQRGVTGPRYILEGPQGFFAAMAPDGTPQAIAARPDARLAIYDTSFKPWPACRHAHPAIDAALLIREALDDVHSDDIASIHVDSYSDAITFCDRVEPTTTAGAKFSLQHVVALALLRGGPKLEDFEPDRLRGNAPSELRRKVTVAASPAFTDVYPAHFGASVRVTMKDGRVVERRIDDAWGDSENPMSDAEVFHKARTLLAAAGVTPERAQALIDGAAALAEGAPFSAIADDIIARRPSFQ